MDTGFSFLTKNDSTTKLGSFAEPFVAKFLELNHHSHLDNIISKEPDKDEVLEVSFYFYLFQGN